VQTGVIQRDAGPVELALIRELFPFSFRVDLDRGGMLCEAGAALSTLLACQVHGEPFSCHFEIERPAEFQLSAEQVFRHADSLVIIRCRASRSLLRMQMVALSDTAILFVGGPLITSATTLEQLNLKRSDFAPHDALPETVVLQRIRDKQVEDLKQQIADLKLALRDSDQYSQWALTDALTQLANRRSFWERCESRLAQRDSADAAVIVMDLNNFKSINDNQGHAVGDAALQMLARHILNNIGADDIAGRLGGDEFAIYLDNTSVTSAEEVGDRIRFALEQGGMAEGESILFSVSMGGTRARPGQTLDELVRDADVAMYEGRRKKVDDIHWFEDSMRERIRVRQELTRDLLKGLAEDEFAPSFQPIVDLESRRVVAFEALARWSCPDGRKIGPDVFIDIAQRAGVVPELDDAILSAALAQLGQWRQSGHDVEIQVNLSGLSILPKLPARVDQLLVYHHIAPHRLTIELTENWLLNNEARTIGILRQLAEIGVKIHLDDFGTGFSSLAHLQTFPITGLKIDRSFVDLALTSERSRRLIDATMGIARSLCIDVVAEGIENEQQAILLQNSGCRLGQGYLFSRPVSAIDATTLLMPQRRVA